MADQGHSADSFRKLAEGPPQLVWTRRADGEAGIEAHLVKPVDVTLLGDALRCDRPA